jgi:hypothetical protein
MGREPKFWFGNALGVAMAVSFLRSAGALPLVSSASAISNSCDPLLLWPRARRGVTMGRFCEAVLVLPAFGGPGAIGITPPFFEFGAPAAEELAVLGLSPMEPVDLGDSESAALCDVGVVTGVCAIEFLRDDFFADRVDAEPTGALPLPRLRFLMTSVFNDRGRTTPCSFKNRPHALQSGCPSGLRRHKGVVWVKQLVHVVGAPPSPCLVPPGLWGRDGAAELKPDSGGEFGED